MQLIQLEIPSFTVTVLIQTVNVPDDITINTTSTSARVTYSASATDASNRQLTVSCNTSSGSNFDLGSTIVTCTAIDSVGNSASETFTVTINGIENITIMTNNMDGAVVTFDSSVISDSRTLQLTCDVPSGSLFDIGITYVLCTATNSVGEKVHKFINVIVEFFSGSQIELYGGMPHNINLDNKTHINSYEGTITTGVTMPNGDSGVIVAGHTLEIYSHETFVENNFGTNPDTTKFSNNPGVVVNRHGVDVAFIPITEENIIAPPYKVQENNRIFDVVSGSLSDLSRNDTVHIVGRHNQGNGTLLYKNATIYNYTDIVQTNMGLADYTSQHGDSGSPIIHKTSSTNTLVGLHTGRTCFYDSPTEGLNMIIHVPPNPETEECTLAFFTPWESAKDALGFE